tara:strand:+ start:1206 stop:2438 length:1233 start_codon:yes stop_codon:yes gene_type:complete
MGLLGALFKPFKKLVKKIGKGIKKVVKKIGRAVGKLGIVGQIGMMFLMPYAAGALGSFFGATGKLASWGSTLLKGSNIASKALGHTLNAINTVGTMAGKVYTGVTETIGKAFDVVTGKAKIGDVGKALQDTVTGVTESTKLMSPKYLEAQQALTASAKEATKAMLEQGFKEKLATDKVPDWMLEQRDQISADDILNYRNVTTTGDIGDAYRVGSGVSLDSLDTKTFMPSPDDILNNYNRATQNKAFTSSIKARTPAEDAVLGDMGDLVLNVEQKQDTLLGKTKDFFRETYEEIKDDVVQEGKQKLKTYAKNKTMEFLGFQEGQQGVQGDNGSYNGSMIPMLSRTDSGVDFTNSATIDAFAKQGNNHLAYSMANLGHVGNLYDRYNNPVANEQMTNYYLAPNINKQLAGAV